MPMQLLRNLAVKKDFGPMIHFVMTETIRLNATLMGVLVATTTTHYGTTFVLSANALKNEGSSRGRKSSINQYFAILIILVSKMNLLCLMSIRKMFDH